MKIWIAVWQFLSNNMTKILGLLQGSVAVLCGANVIPDNELKYWMAAGALFTFWRGFANSGSQSVMVQTTTVSVPTPPEKPEIPK